MEFGHSEGTFTLKKILVYLVKKPSELRNSQRGARESYFVFCHVWPWCKPPNVTTPQFFFFGHSLGTITPWKTNLTRQVWSGTSP